MSYVNLNYHIIFGTKHRQDLIIPNFQERLYEYLGGIVKNKNGSLIEIGGTENHVHILASFHQTKDVASTVRDLKSNSAGWLNELDEYPKSFTWQTKYGAFTVSQSNILEVVRYIQNQEEHHRTKTYQEEFIEFLDRHDIDYNEEYLWE